MHPRHYDKIQQDNNKFITANQIAYTLAPVEQYQHALSQLSLNDLEHTLHDYSVNGIKRNDFANRISMAIAAENVRPGILDQLTSPVLRDALEEFITHLVEAVKARDIAIFDKLNASNSIDRSVISDYALESQSLSQCGLRQIYEVIIHELAAKKDISCLNMLINTVGGDIIPYVLHAYAKIDYITGINTVIENVETTTTDPRELVLLNSAIVLGFSENNLFKTDVSYVIKSLLEISNKALRNSLLRKAKKYHPNIVSELSDYEALGIHYYSIKEKQAAAYKELQKPSVESEFSTVEMTAHIHELIYNATDKPITTYLKELECILHASTPSNTVKQLLGTVHDLLDSKKSIGFGLQKEDPVSHLDPKSHPLTKYVAEIYQLIYRKGWETSSRNNFVMTFRLSARETQFYTRGIVGKIFNSWTPIPIGIKEAYRFLNLKNNIEYQQIVDMLFLMEEKITQYACAHGGDENHPDLHPDTIKFLKDWIARAKRIEVEAKLTGGSPIHLNLSAADLKAKSNARLHLSYANIQESNNKQIQEWDNAVIESPVKIDYQPLPTFGVGTLDWLIDQFAHTNPLPTNSIPNKMQEHLDLLGQEDEKARAAEILTDKKTVDAPVKKAAVATSNSASAPSPASASAKMSVSTVSKLDREKTDSAFTLARKERLEAARAAEAKAIADKYAEVTDYLQHREAEAKAAASTTGTSATLGQATTPAALVTDAPSDFQPVVSASKASMFKAAAVPASTAAVPATATRTVALKEAPKTAQKVAVNAPSKPAPSKPKPAAATTKHAPATKPASKQKQPGLFVSASAQTVETLAAQKVVTDALPEIGTAPAATSTATPASRGAMLMN